MFSGRQPRQGVKVSLCFRNWLRPHLQVVADGLVELKLIGFGSGQENFIEFLVSCWKTQRDVTH